MRAYQWLRALARRLRAALFRDDFEREMDEEMRFHLEREIEDRVERGMSPEEARRTAHRDFGGVDRQKERAREARGLALVDGIRQDLVFGFRVLRNRPVVSLAAAATLAVGIGLSATIFSIADMALFRPPAGVEEPDELVVVRMRAPHLDDEETFISAPNVRDLRAMEIPAIAELTALPTASFHVAVPGRATMILEGGAPVGDYFGALGVRASEGRLFGAGPGRGGPEEEVVVLSERAREELFGKEGSVVGRRISVNGVELTVVGVAGRDFQGTVRGVPSDLWIPYAIYPRVRHGEGRSYQDRGATTLSRVLARLAPGASPEQAEVQLRQAMDRLVARHPGVNAAYADYRPTVYADIGAPPATRERARTIVTLLLAAAGLLLLVACANVANLLVFSGVRRRGESAVRQTMGASRARLVRQHLTESALLATGGVVGGLLLTGFLLEVAPLWILPLAEASDLALFRLDARVTTFAVALGALTVALAGLAPALTVGDFDLSEVLKGITSTSTGPKARLRTGLTTVQIALSLALVVGALLMQRTLGNLTGLELGLDAEDVTYVRVDPEPQGYTRSQSHALRRELLRGAREIPGVTAAAGASEGPLAGHVVTDLRAGGDATDGWPVSADQDEVTPGYFETLGIPVLRGRDFSGAELERSFEEGDAGAEGGSDAERSPVAGGVAIVSETLARRLFGTLDAVGRTVVARGYRSNDRLEIVGVVADHRNRSLHGPAAPVLFRPLGDGLSRGMVLVVRSPRPTRAVLEGLRDVADAVDPTLPFYESGALPRRVLEATRTELFLSRLMSLLAVGAGFLAGIGLYGLVASSVAERRREVGVRMAMGADRAEVVRAVVGDALRLVGLGVVAGAGVAWLMTRALEAWLFGVAPLDPFTWAAATGGMVALGILAAAGPARSAARVDPMEVLKTVPRTTRT